jgi:hypothetical protein
MRKEPPSLCRILSDKGAGSLELLRIQEQSQKTTHPKIKHLILLRQTHHERILSQIIFPARILLISPLHLLLQRLYILRQQASQFKLPPLFRREPGSLVQVSCVEECRAGQRAGLRAGGAEGEVSEFRMLGVRVGLFVLGGHCCFGSFPCGVEGAPGELGG